MQFQLLHGDCVSVMPTLPDEGVDAIVTDPPYGLSFMGKDWDHGVPGEHFWSEAIRVAKPGAHLLAFGGTRMVHRLAVAIEDAGWEIRDTVMWVYGSGFPKSLDVSKAIDKAAGADREVIGLNEDYLRRKPNGMKTAGATAYGYSQSQQETDARITAPATEAAQRWQGWGTALKPAWEPIIVARKPLIGTVAENVLKHGTGALNIDGCRVGTEDLSAQWNREWNQDESFGNGKRASQGKSVPPGRWPANLIHDGSDEVVGLFPSQKSGANPTRRGSRKFRNTSGGFNGQEECEAQRGAEPDSAARFFYCAKASKKDRDEDNSHPTVKPTDLMRYLCRLVTPPAGVILDPFMGSGSTGKAAILEGFRFIGIERMDEYLEIARARIEAADREPRGLF